MKSTFWKSISLLAVSSIASAGTTTGTVNQLYIHEYNDSILFNMTSQSQNFIGCATTKRYAVSTSTQQGKNILSTILAAKISDKSVMVVGENTCTTHGDAEDISWMRIN